MTGLEHWAFGVPELILHLSSMEVVMETSQAHLSAC